MIILITKLTKTTIIIAIVVIIVFVVIPTRGQAKVQGGGIPLLQTTIDNYNPFGRNRWGIPHPTTQGLPQGFGMTVFF